MVQAVVMVTDWIWGVSVGDLAGSFAVWVETLLPVKQSDVEALHWVCSPLTSVFMATGAGHAQLESKVGTNRALQCEKHVKPVQCNFYPCDSFNKSKNAFCSTQNLVFMK